MAVSKAFEAAAPGEYFEGVREGYRSAGTREEVSVISLRRAERDAQVMGAIAPPELTAAERSAARRVDQVGTAPFRALVGAGLHTLTTGCTTGCAAPNATKLVRWRAVSFQRVTFARIARDRVNMPLQEFAEADGSIGTLLRRIGVEQAARDAAAARAKAIEADIAALDEKAGQQPRASFLPDAAKLRSDLSDAGLPALAKLAGLEKVGGVLDDLLAVELGAAAADAKGEAGEESASSAAIKRAQAMLQLVGAAEEVAVAYADFPAANRVSALLIAKAAARQQLDVARLDAELSADLLRLHQARLDALAIELSRLSEAELALRNVRGDSARGVLGLTGTGRTWFTRALVQFGVATSNGRLVAEQAEMRELQLRRTHQVDLGERTAVNRRALIAPAVAQMEAAGKVGVRPELIVNLAGQLGITTSVLVN